MLLDPRALVLFAANALLLHLSLMVNSALSGWALYLLLAGPMVVLPALYLRHRAYFVTTLLSGLWVDAALPANFGSFTLSFLLAGAVISHLRIRFRAEHNYHPVLLAHGVNAFLLLMLTLTEAHGQYHSAAFWQHVGLTLLLSHLLLLLVAPWFFDLQRALLELCGLDSEPDDFPA